MSTLTFHHRGDICSVLSVKRVKRRSTFPSSRAVSVEKEMSLFEEYESLKRRGTWMARLNYIRSLPDQTAIEAYLKQSVSDGDLQMFLFLSLSNKNQSNLLEIFNANHLPVRQRTKAGEAWLRLAIDEEQVHHFVTTTTIDPNIPRR